MAVKNRVCYCCGKIYQYCPNCSGYDPNKTYMFLVHDEKCNEVYNICNAYKGKELTREEAAKALKALNVDYILKAEKSAVKALVKEILDVKDAPAPKAVTKEIKQEAKADDKQEKGFQKDSNNKK